MIKKLWFPWNVLSRIISRHQVIEIINMIIILRVKILFNIKFINIIFEIIKLKVLIDIKIGHGLRFRMK
jgi:hypothetical protein